MTPPTAGKSFLPEALDFLDLLNSFRLTRRKLLCKGSDIEENDSEHSYQLAMLSWYFLNKAKLPLDQNKVIRFALVHDFPEVYAGDTPVFGPGSETRETKHTREAAAIERLEQEWEEKFPEFIAAIKEYESKESEEAKFVYALDKVIAPMNIFLDGGRNWKRFEVTLEVHNAEKRPKVEGHQTVADLLEEFIVLATEHKHLFHEPKV